MRNMQNLAPYENFPLYSSWKLLLDKNFAQSSYLCITEIFSGVEYIFTNAVKVSGYTVFSDPLHNLIWGEKAPPPPPST